jgi:hypothetical protein
VWRIFPVQRKGDMASGSSVTLLVLLVLAPAVQALDQVKVDGDGRGFVLHPSGRPFVPWGFNYDHDEEDRLLEDYWDREWPKVEEDFAEMKSLGANVVRVHLQLGKLLLRRDEIDATALARLRDLLTLAERLGLYLDITGLGCYRKADVPGWYDALSEDERWDAQARFWTEVAACCAHSSALFCYDLMNEPVVAGAKRDAGDWLGPPFAGKYHYVQFVTLDPAGRPRPEVAQAWVRRLKAAIRARDPEHLVTVGLVDWSLDRPGLTSGFVPREVAPELDFLSVHLYPEAGKLAEALGTLRGFAVGKPILVEETFPLRCPLWEFRSFLRQSRAVADGWVGFYWGATPEDCRRSTQLRDQFVLAWLELFAEERPDRAGTTLPDPPLQR